MERKRKLPARAAARVEQAAKKRHLTPREPSKTPTPQPVEETPPPPALPPPPPLPRSIQVGKPLPTVEDAQPDDLSTKEFQSVSESGVLAESLSRSRHKWISEGLFEKYWTKPHKRKGVLNEDPKNPPKDSMTKVGTVTITIEPHIIEATMYAVKESKLKPQALPQQSADKPQLPQQKQPQQQPNTDSPSQQSPQPTATPASQPPAPPLARPIIQYGPPNGAMPPPPNPMSTTGAPATGMTTPKPASASPAPSPVPSPALHAPQATQNSPRPSPGPSPGPQHATPTNLADPAKSASTALPMKHAGPPASPVFVPKSSPAPSAASPLARPPSHPPAGQALAPSPAANHAVPVAGRPPGSAAPAASPAANRPSPSAPGTPAPAAAKPAANDPVIALLAQKASGDPELRDLMKRVAVGQAKDGELAHFQKIIDQLNAEYKRKGGQQGPSADRLLVDGRTVKYFADEVRTILDIVLASNPQQKSTELRPPPRSDPLVVLLVKTALEDQRTKDMIKRIAEGRPGFTDATDLKDILDRLHRDAKTVPQTSPIPPQAKPAVPNGLPNGHVKAGAPHTTQQPNAQALRSKGPPPVAKPDISAVVFDFGSGDRYLFPKYSILEYLPTPSGQQVVVSFLIVRKGSTSEYGGDPDLDYYQPVTIRLYTHAGRHLENIARVVAPQDEVRRYMDDVMDNMTRAEYVLLAMRLPRAIQDADKEISVEEPKANGATPKAEPEPEQTAPPKPGVLWTTGGSSTGKSINAAYPLKVRDAEQESQAKYERLIRTVAAKDAEAV